MELVNCHTHTVYSGHGAGSVEELVSAAKRAGLRTLAITEHYPLPQALDPTHENAIQEHELPQYLQEIHAAQAAQEAACESAQEQGGAPLEIIAGAEIDWLGAQEERTMDAHAFEPFSYTLLSVHFIDGWGFDDPAYLDGWKERGANEVWRRYVELWIQAACSDWPVHAMAHPDLVKKFGYYPSFDVGKCYKEMVEALASTHKIIEVNAAGAYYDCKEMYPSLELLRLFCKAGVLCSVGTDAHTPAHVTRGLSQAYALMYEAGYRAITVPTQSGDYRLVPFD